MQCCSWQRCQVRVHLMVVQCLRGVLTAMASACCISLLMPHAFIYCTLAMAHVQKDLHIEACPVAATCCLAGCAMGCSNELIHPCSFVQRLHKAERQTSAPSCRLRRSEQRNELTGYPQPLCVQNIAKQCLKTQDQANPAACTATEQIEATRNHHFC